MSETQYELRVAVGIMAAFFASFATIGAVFIASYSGPSVPPWLAYMCGGLGFGVTVTILNSAAIRLWDKRAIEFGVRN